jgi:hypothetical protein
MPKKIKPAELKYHPLCEIFPGLDDDARKSFEDDIYANGQRFPVMLYKGLVLDGRNRVKACVKLKLEVLVDDLPEDTDPVAYVISANLARRHLNESQRSLIAGKLVTAKLGANQFAGQAVTIGNAAKMFSVSEASVKTAKTVLEKAHPGIIAKVEQGELRVGALTEVIKMPQYQQEGELNRLKDAAEKKRTEKAEAKKKNTPKVAPANQPMADVDEFVKKWQSFNVQQRRAFVDKVKADITELLKV